MNDVLIVGAGAAGLMAGRELARAGKRVTILEARDRCGGRIYPLPAALFGYPAEGGAEFVHGDAPLTTALVHEAGLSLSPIAGTRWTVRDGKPSQNRSSLPYADELHEALAGLRADLPIAAFLATHFGGAQYGELRRSLLRMVEGYDAADPSRASTFALRDEWMNDGLGEQHRIVEGYGALIAFLEAGCRRQGAAIHLDAVVTGIEAGGGQVDVHRRDGAVHAADAAVVTVPPSVLSAIVLPPEARAMSAAYADIGYGNVVKILVRFATKWWAEVGGRDLADLAFVFGNAAVPTWWTQHPAECPVLTGWYAGLKADSVADRSESELVEMGIASLAEISGRSVDDIARQVVAATAINWGNDPFARGAYSYATPKTHEAQSALKELDGSLVFFSGEALYGGREMGTVEAALASGRETAQAIVEMGR